MAGKTTRYFKLERSTQQCDPISAYLFILVLVIAFVLIKTNNNIEGLKIFNHNFLYTAYADDTTFFIKNVNSATEIIKTFDFFSLFSGLNINKTKFEIAGSGVLKGVKLAICGMKCVKSYYKASECFKRVENEKLVPFRQDWYF